MHKVVSELVYFPHEVFVPRTTTLRSSSKLLYIPLCLKLVLLGIAYQTRFLMLKLYLYLSHLLVIICTM